MVVFAKIDYVESGAIYLQVCPVCATRVGVDIVAYKNWNMS